MFLEAAHGADNAQNVLKSRLSKNKLSVLGYEIGNGLIRSRLQPLGILTKMATLK